MNAITSIAADRPTLAEVADASGRAYRAAVELADVLAILPASTGRAIVDGLLGAVDDVRAARGLDALGYSERPTRAELSASWRALEPEPDAAARARRSFAACWNALTDEDRAAFYRQMRRRVAA